MLVGALLFVEMELQKVGKLFGSLLYATAGVRDSESVPMFRSARHVITTSFVHS